MKEGTPKAIYLKDYKKPDYYVEQVHLDIKIHDGHTIVDSKIDFIINEEVAGSDPKLVLDGELLKLKSIAIDGQKLSEDAYEVFEEKLEIKKVPHKFTCEITVEIDPDNNKALEGLYKSGDIYCTQMESQGFRKLTYYLDRPDVLAKFTTRVEANKKQFPILLSNGNKIDSGELDGGRHFTIWEDPFKKPAYLFAVVAGDLGLVKGTYKTISGREVALEIYVDKGNEDKCDWAMRSLKESMRWDEQRFDLEYDLDIYMIVAVDAFNMGAMENKGLNIFNSHYVLAKKETATDSDFIGVEAVIGHEYFHNWTGNRVTCRDWFQLTLKEGLTVFRDQEFTSDLNSRSVKRIDDVRGLRGHQFPEDEGPMSHPIRPESYIEINNFYTSTVYEKGAEIIRMIHTIIGEENFQKGMKLYFERHDGDAVTTEDFLAAMSDASGEDLTLFQNWYKQNGTPRIKVTKTFANGKVKIDFEQSVNKGDKLTLHMPFKFAGINAVGEEVKADFIHLKEKKTSIDFDSKEDVALSLNRGFTTPVHIDYEYTDNELYNLMAHDSDEFSRWDATQKLYERTIFTLREANQKEQDPKSLSSFYEAFEKLLNDKKVDQAFLAEALTLPSEAFLNDLLETPDYDGVHTSRECLANNLAHEFFNPMKELYQSFEKDKFDLSPKAMGRRALKNRLLSFLIRHPNGVELARAQFANATNMTDEISSLSLLINEGKADSEIGAFFSKWKDDFLVLNKWFAVQAGSKDEKVLERLRILERHPKFDDKNPNMLRSLYASFARNLVHFNKPDGSGYEFVAGKIRDIDGYNPQIAARFCSVFNRYSKLDKTRKSLMKKHLESISSKEGLSRDTYEIVSKTLAN